MATSVQRRAGQKSITAADAKRRVLVLIAEGNTVEKAMASVGRMKSTYEDWYKKDTVFADEVRILRAGVAKAKETGKLPLPDFETFCREWLNAPLFPHQLRQLDIIEGRPPRDLHASMVYEPGEPGRVLYNMPPEHAKTTTWSIHYSLYQILANPDIKIVIISKTQGLAKQILGAVKHRLTSPAFSAMQMAFGPEGGFKDSEASWTQTEIYVAGRGETQGTLIAKDPTMQAIGIGGQLYGARSDIIILDDGVTLSNVSQHVTQLAWLRQEADTRLPPEGGLLLILGTRVAPVDLYSEVRQLEDLDGNQYFTYLAQPAVLEFADSRDDWVTLWPSTFDQAGNDKPMWTGPRLAKKRGFVGERTWALVYQQADVVENAVFNQRALEASVNNLRSPGLMTVKGMGHRHDGMAGLYVVGGLDPATVGKTAMLIVGIDRQTQKRYILDGFNKAATTPTQMRDAVKNFTDKYAVNEWVIERNAFQRFLTQDPELRAYLFARGCKLTEHHTGNNKKDPDFGVMSLAPLFESCGHPPSADTGGKWVRTPDTALIELPVPRSSQWVQELIAELTVWQPTGMSQLTKTDLVMALWFTEIAAQRILGVGRTRVTHVQNKWLTASGRKNQKVIPLHARRDALLAEQDQGLDGSLRPSFLRSG